MNSPTPAHQNRLTPLVQRLLVLVCVVGLCLTACQTASQRAESVRSSFIGVAGYDVRDCFGGPRLLVVRPQEEVLVYAWPPSRELVLSNGYEEFLHHAANSASFGVRPSKRAGQQMFPYCVARVVLRDGEIASIESTGHTYSGLRTTAECMIDAEQCLHELPRRFPLVAPRDALQPADVTIDADGPRAKP